MSKLIQFKVDVNLQTEDDGSSPLILAVGNDTKEIEEYQQYYGSEWERYKTIKYLPKKDGKIDLCRKDGASPLYVACQRGYYNIVKLLLKQGAEINLCLKYVTTPLYAASENGHEKTVQLLLDNKADSDIITSSLYSESIIIK